MKQQSSRFILIGGFVITSIIPLVMIAFWYVHVLQMQVYLKKIHNEYIESRLIYKMSDISRERSVIIYQMALLDDPFERLAISETGMELGGVFVEAREKLLTMPSFDGNDHQAWDIARRNINKGENSFLQVIDLFLEGSDEKARKLLLESYKPEQGIFLKDLTRMLSLQNIEVDKVSGEAFNTNQFYLYLAMIIGVAGVVISILVAVFVYRRISRAEETLIEANKSAQVANNSKSQFIANMSHELRTPLNAILGFAQIIKQDPRLEEKVKRSYADQIITAGWHLLSLINDILDLAKIEKGKLDIKPVPVNLGEICEVCIELTKNMEEKYDVTLEKNIGQLTGICILADKKRLQQILLNFISNAIKYNVKGGTVSVDASLGRPGFVLVSVTNTGPGIKPEEIDKLFTPFSRMASSANIEGTGIGLMICKNLVTVMGGEIGVESDKDKTTFWFDLPIANECGTGLGPGIVKEETNKQSQELVNNKYRILYVEDNKENAYLIESFFSARSEFDVVVKTTGTDGLAYVSEYHPDIILMDINLPDMDGFEALAYLKNNAGLCEIPVLAVSASAMPNDIERGLQAGFIEYVTKPLDLSRLLSIIDSILQIKR